MPATQALRELSVYRRSLILTGLLLSSALAVAQVAPSAYRSRASLTVGGYYSYFDADYANNEMGGVGAYVDWSPGFLGRLAVEGEGRWLIFNAPHDFSEYNYLIGPRYKVLVHNHLQLYAKILLGAGEVNFPYQLAHGGYFALAPGGGIDFAATRHWRLRADYEYQILPDAVGIPGIPSNSLKPNGVSVGVGYRIF
jgi:outer membrane protein with beta-barrel domain